MKTHYMNSIGRFALTLLLFFAVGSSSLFAQKNVYKQDIQKALDRLPSKAKLEKLDVEEQKALEETRSAWKALKAVDDLDSKEGKRVLERVRANIEELEDMAEDRSCTQRCYDERSDCIDRQCGGRAPLIGCLCCIPCNVAWTLCIADCLTSG